jgi:hypothetical protein
MHSHVEGLNSQKPVLDVRHGDLFMICSFIFL